MNDMPGGPGGPGGFNDPMGDKPITVTSVLKEFQGLKDKFKNEDEDDCELLVPPLLLLQWVKCREGKQQVSHAPLPQTSL